MPRRMLEWSGRGRGEREHSWPMHEGVCAPEIALTVSVVLDSRQTGRMAGEAAHGILREHTFIFFLYCCPLEKIVDKAGRIHDVVLCQGSAQGAIFYKIL